MGKAFRLRDGRIEASIHLALPNGPSGVLAALQGNFGQVAEVDEALRRMPRAATGVQATRLKPGNVLRQVDALIREHLPEVGGALDGAYGQLAAATGVSVREDLFGLGEVSCFSFSVPPPAGGLFADRLMLVKTREVAPYWQLLGKVAAHIGTRVQSQEWSGNKLEYVPIVIDGLSPGADPGELLLGGMPGPTELVILAQAWILSGGVSLNTVARADLPGGWTVLSNVPQSVARYLTHYREGPPLSGDTELLALAREQLTGAASASVSRGDHSLLWIYNTLLTVGTSFSPFLSQVGIDIARLPPGEAFLGSPGPGHSRLMLARNGFTLRGRSSFESSSSLLIALAATGMVAGVVMPTYLSSGREEAYKVQCASNLKSLYTYSMLYANKTTRAFPHDPKGSVASLQKLVDYFPEDLRPQFFICSKGHAIEAATRPDGAFRLTGETCSYEIVPWRVKVTAGVRRVWPALAAHARLLCELLH